MPPLTFLEEKGGMLLGNTVKLTQVALGLVPEVLNAIVVGCKQLGVVEPQMPEAGEGERIVAGEGITIDDGVGHDPLLQDWHQGRGLGVGDDHGIDLATPVLTGQTPAPCPPRRTHACPCAAHQTTSISPANGVVSAMA